MTPSSFNYSWTILFSLLTIVSCGQATNDKTDTPKTIRATVQPIDTSLIAIISYDNSRDWLFDKTHSPATLTQADIEKIERLMTDCVNKYNNKLSADNKQHFSIDLTNEKYKRQYVAVTSKNGDKEVWINCLCQTHGDDWKTSIIMVDDGGNCYFNLKINLTKEKCYDFGVNGYAWRQKTAAYIALAIWRGDEYMLSFLFATQLQFRQTNNAKRHNKQWAFVSLISSGYRRTEHKIPPHPML